MGLMSDDYFKNLAASAQPAPAPTAPPPQPGGLVAAENAVAKPIEQAQVAATQGYKPSLTPAEQTAKFGGLIGSTEYLANQAAHPYKTFFLRGLSESLGIKLPDQQTWDGLSISDKAKAASQASSLAALNMVVRAPRQIVTAPVRIAATIAAPWVSLAKGQGGSYNDLVAEKPLELPWLGTVPNYFQSYDQARKTGLGPLGATLATGSLALGDVTIGASMAEALTKAFQPRAQVSGNPVLDTQPIKSAITQEEGALKVKRGQTDSPSEYYSLPKSTAAKYGGHSGNTFVKLTPSGTDGAVEVAIVQTRKGIVQSVADRFMGGRTQGDFGPEIKLESSVVPTTPQGTTAEPFIPPAEPAPITAIPPKPLKGFEAAPITAEQVTNLGRISQAAGVDPNVAGSLVKTLTGKSAVGELTQSEYVQVAQSMAALQKSARALPGSPVVNPVTQWLSPQRHWMRTYEEKSGIPLYSEAYVPMEDAARFRNTFRDNWRTQARDLFGEYAKPGFAEERRLIKNYMEGDVAAVEQNPNLTPKVKADLANIAGKLRTFYDETGPTFGIEPDFFLKNYQPHIQDVGGIYQLYKEGSTIPDKLSFFAEKKRNGALATQVDDALALFDIYINAGSNKTFLNPALERVAALGESLPATLQNSVKSYVGEKLGYAGRVEQYLNEIGPKIGKQLGLNLPDDVARQATQYAMDTSYAGALGMRPGAVVRNALQNPLLTYPRLGPAFYAQAVAKALTEDGVAELRSKGFLVDLGVPYGEELAKERTAAGKLGTTYRNLSQASIAPYSAADNFTRAATYWQTKYQWEDAFAQYKSGKLTWDGLEKKIDMNSLSPIDRNIVRQRLVAGDNEGAFNHFVRDVLDETQFPYRRGSSSRVTYGLGGKIATQFGQWNIEYVHTLARWLKTGQYDKLIRWHAAAAATTRTLQDTFGFDASKWSGLKAVNPTLSPFVQFASEFGQMVQQYRAGNDQEMQVHAENLVNAIKSLGRPAGVQLNNWSNFWKSWKAGPVGPDGQYPVYSTGGKLKYYSPFKDIWWNMLGFPSSQQAEETQTQNQMQSSLFNYNQTKAKVLELYQQEKFDEANQLIADHNITITPGNFDAYHIPLNQRTFQALPPALQAQFAPKVYK